MGQNKATDVGECVVLKFGSSVLASEAYLTHAVHEVYRHVREGRKVVAVVSAVGATTNHLLAHASRYGRRVSEVGLAALAATGEARSAALLTLALDRAGVPCEVLDAGAIDLRTTGEVCDATPVRVDVEAIERALARSGVLVVPGFVGRDDAGRATLLGRGGSDFTAVFLAGALGCACVLVKDVDALFDRDPALDPQHARRLQEASYDDVLSLSEGIVQHKAVRFAKQRGVSIGIARVGHEVGTIVHARATKHGAVGVAQARPPMRVALLGLGTVGLGVYEHLDRLSDLFEVTHVVVRDEARASDLVRGSVRVDTDPLAIARQADCDVIVEALGGVEPALHAIRTALSRGVHVVSANKAAIASDVKGLHALALERSAQLAYSASVGGGVPVLERVRAITKSEQIVEVSGVLNGTCNFVLDQLSRGATLDAAVKAAQDAGFAEADPSADLDGVDAANKLSLIAHAAWGVVLPIDQIARSSVRSITRDQVASARTHGRTYRAIATVRREADKVTASVAAREVDSDSPFASAREEDNCVLIKTAQGTQHVLRGRGAGRFPTAESVVGDLLALAREVRRG